MPDKDAGLQALGQFAYEFSRLIHFMRWFTAQMTLVSVPQRLRSTELWNAVAMQTGEMTADQLRNVFFGVAETVGGYTGDEAVMARRLYNSLKPFIELRNDFFHGEWMIGWGSTVGIEVQNEDGTTEVRQTSALLNPSVTRTRPGRTGEKQRETVYTDDELNALSHDLRALRHLVANWGRVVAGQSLIQPLGDEAPEGWRRARPSDVYVLREGQVLWDGPLASRCPFFEFD